jgi:hypothetical protein
MDRASREGPWSRDQEGDYLPLVAFGSSVAKMWFPRGQNNAPVWPSPGLSVPTYPPPAFQHAWLLPREQSKQPLLIPVMTGRTICSLPPPHVLVERTGVQVGSSQAMVLF